METDEGQPKLIEPQLGGIKHFVQILEPPKDEILNSKWLIYKIPDWLSDDSVNNCLICDVKFSFLTRRHHCRACGGIYCSDCCSSALPLPQFNVLTPERLCTECIKKQTRIFEIKSTLIHKNGILDEYNKKYHLLQTDFSDLLKSGCSFVKYDKHGYYNIKLTYNDKQKLIEEKYIHLNKIVKMNLNKVTIKTQADPGICEIHGKALLSYESSCFTMIYDDQIFVYKPIKADYSRWFEGLILAKFSYNFDKDVLKLQNEIKEISDELDATIKSQTSFAISKVFRERESPLVLLEEQSDDYNEDNISEEEDDENIFKSSRKSIHIPSFENKIYSTSTPKDIAPKALKIASFSKSNVYSKTLPNNIHNMKKYDMENSQSQVEFWNLEKKAKTRTLY